jgi:DeoR/GlpR family transcriptional regulator of sugar metabolism
MTEVHLEEAQLKRKAIEATTQVIALVDSSKFGKKDLTLFCRLEQITQLFVDPGLERKWIDQLNQAGIHYKICEEESVAEGM